MNAAPDLAQPPALLTSALVKAQMRPPLLSTAELCAISVQDHEDLLKLVKAYTPQLAQRGGLDTMATLTLLDEFYNEFSRDMFPLDYNYIEYINDCHYEYDHLQQLAEFNPLRDYLDFIHPKTIGISKINGYPHDAWEQLDTTLALLLLLVDPETLNHPAEQGIRISWLESAASHVSQETLSLLPKDGYSTKTLAEALKNSEFEGLNDALAFLDSDTGNLVLDTGPMAEDFDYQYGDEWNHENVQANLETHQQAKEIMGRIERLADWMRQQPLDDSFAEIIRHVNQACQDA